MQEDGRPYEKLVDVADILRLDSCVLGTRIGEFRERCKQAFDTRAGHPIARYQLFCLPDSRSFQELLTLGIAARARPCPLGYKLKLRAQPVNHCTGLVFHSPSINGGEPTIGKDFSNCEKWGYDIRSAGSFEDLRLRSNGDGQKLKKRRSVASLHFRVVAGLVTWSGV